MRAAQTPLADHMWPTCLRPPALDLTGLPDPDLWACKTIRCSVLKPLFRKNLLLGLLLYTVFSGYFSFPVKCVSIYLHRKSFILMGNKRKLPFRRKKV